MVKKGSIRQPTLWVQQIGEAWRTWTGSTGVYVLILLLLAEYWRAGIADRINQPLLGWLFYLSLLVIIPLVLVVCLNLS